MDGTYNEGYAFVLADQEILEFEKDNRISIMPEIANSSQTQSIDTKVYYKIDGVDVSLSPLSETIPQGNSSFLIPSVKFPIGNVDVGLHKLQIELRSSDSQTLYDSLSFLFKTKDILPEGLIAYYPFDGNANDFSGNGNNGYSNRVTFIAGGSGMVAQFLSSSYIDVTDNNSFNFSNTTCVTIVAWVRQEQGTTGDILRIMGNGYMEDDEYGLEINATGRLSGAFNGPGGQQKTIQSNSSLTLNTWSHVVLMWNKADSKISFYINGVLDKRINSPVLSIQNTDVRLRIGHALQDYLNSFIGSIDQIRIYNRTLTDAEIQLLYIN